MMSWMKMHRENKNKDIHHKRRDTEGELSNIWSKRATQSAFPPNEKWQANICTYLPYRDARGNWCSTKAAMQTSLDGCLPKRNSAEAMNCSNVFRFLRSSCTFSHCWSFCCASAHKFAHSEWSAWIRLCSWNGESNEDARKHIWSKKHNIPIQCRSQHPGGDLLQKGSLLSSLLKTVRTPPPTLVSKADMQTCFADQAKICIY